MAIKCELTTLESQPSLAIRVNTSAHVLPKVLAKGFAEIAEYLRLSNTQAAGPAFTIYYNLDMRCLDVEFGYPVSAVCSDKDNIRVSHTPSGKAVTCLRTGSYMDLEPAYRALTEWIKDHGYESAGIAYEQYLTDPLKTPPSKLNTQVYELTRAIQF